MSCLTNVCMRTSETSLRSCLHCSIPFPSLISATHRERENQITRYDAWRRLREKAIINAGGKLPPGVDIDFPPPEPFDTIDPEDVTFDLTAAHIEAEAVDFGEEGPHERVPHADLEFEGTGQELRVSRLFLLVVVVGRVKVADEFFFSTRRRCLATVPRLEREWASFACWTESACPAKECLARFVGYFPSHHGRVVNAPHLQLMLQCCGIYRPIVVWTWNPHHCRPWAGF